jgi:hypothetical protein
MTNIQHTPTQAKRLMGAHLQYSYRNWSDAFQCPTCEQKRRYSLNFLGQRKVICDGVKIAASQGSK